MTRRKIIPAVGFIVTAFSVCDDKRNMEKSMLMYLEPRRPLLLRDLPASAEVSAELWSIAVTDTSQSHRCLETEQMYHRGWCPMNNGCHDLAVVKWFHHSHKSNWCSEEEKPMYYNIIFSPAAISSFICFIPQRFNNKQQQMSPDITARLNIWKPALSWMLTYC